MVQVGLPPERPIESPTLWLLSFPGRRPRKYRSLCVFCWGLGLAQVAAQEASDCRAKLTRDMLELGKIVSVKTGHVSGDGCRMTIVTGKGAFVTEFPNFFRWFMSQVGVPSSLNAFLNIPLVLLRDGFYQCLLSDSLSSGSEVPIANPFLKAVLSPP